MTARASVPAGQRREIVAVLRAEGHSLRAIAGAVGVDPKTVRNDIEAGGEMSPPAEVNGQDGKTYPASKPPKQQRACPVCGESLHGRRRDARVCSATCRREASRLRRLHAGLTEQGYSDLRSYLDRRQRRANAAGEA